MSVTVGGLQAFVFMYLVDRILNPLFPEENLFLRKVPLPLRRASQLVLVKVPPLGAPGLSKVWHWGNASLILGQIEALAAMGGRRRRGNLDQLGIN